MTDRYHRAIGKPADYGQELLRRRGRVMRRYTTTAGRRILDYGCGNGAQTITLTHDAALVVGMDVSLDHLMSLKHHLAEDPPTALATVCVNGSSIPSPDATYDLVVSFEVLEHVEDEATTLQEIYRVLKPSGEFVVTVPNKWWIFETHGARLPVLKWNRVPFFSWLPQPLHRRWALARIYRRPQIRALLESAGFQVVASTYITAPLDVLRPRLLQTWLRKTVFHADCTRVPFLATAILLYCRKPGEGES